MEERTYARECGLRCSRLRMAQGMSQQELADKVFTTAQNISKYEKNGISNIDMIHKISDALGHDLLVDETDAEGEIGEVGKEILWRLIEKGGYKLVPELAHEDMHGMGMNRINHEIFKLEHIGMCVREQYIDFDETQKDQLFITAKGLIAYKGIIGRGLFKGDVLSMIDEAVSYEELIGDAESYQGFINQRQFEKLIRGIESMLTWDHRLNYVQWLKTNFEAGIEDDHNALPDPWSNVVTAKSFYYDLIYRMAMGLDKDKYRLLFEYGEADAATDYAMEELEKRLEGASEDPVIRQAEAMFKDIFQICNEVEVDEEEKRRSYQGNYEEDQQRLSQFQEWNEELDAYYYSPEEVFNGMIEKKERLSPLPTRWFSEEEVWAFLRDNVVPASDEFDKKLDGILSEINRLEPKTLDYYSFPSSWEENGMAEYVREAYGLQKKN